MSLLESSAGRQGSRPRFLTSRHLAWLDTLGNRNSPWTGLAQSPPSPWHRLLGLLSLRKKNSAPEPHPSLALLLPRSPECQSQSGDSLRRCLDIRWGHVTVVGSTHCLTEDETQRPYPQWDNPVRVLQTWLHYSLHGLSWPLCQGLKMYPPE